MPRAAPDALLTPVPRAYTRDESLPDRNAMPRWTAVVLAALLGVTSVLPAAAQWKWRDRSGHTQYSDLPPPAGVAERDILQRPQSSGPQRAAGTGTGTGAVPVSAAQTAASAAPLFASKASDPELEARRKKIEQDAADKKKAGEAKADAAATVAKADNCARAKAQMRTLDSGLRMSRTNEKGEREFLDDAARADETKRTREVIGTDCR